MKLAAPDAPGADRWRKSLLCETYGHGYGVTILGRMVTDGRWKYAATEDTLDELYDLEADPYELKNLAVLPEYDGKKQEMRKLLTEQQEKAEDPVRLEQLLGKTSAE